MIDASYINDLFSGPSLRQGQQQGLSRQALGRGIDRLQAGKYSEAVGEFRKAVALNPQSLDAYTYMGAAYLKLKNYKEAINAYTHAVKLAPNSTQGHNNLGNAYVEAGRYGDAEKEFKAAERIDPLSTYAPYTLGHIYTEQGRYREAEAKFQNVVRLTSQDPNAHFGLGFLYNKMGQYDKAVSELTKTVQLKSAFADAYFELGIAYAGQGDQAGARKQIDILKKLDSTLAQELTVEVTMPKNLGAIFGGTFDTTLGSGTTVASLDPSLAAPGASKDFTVVFQFLTDMDTVSVQNIANWRITRASGGEAGLYNNGVTLHAEQEIAVSVLPRSVSYDPFKLRATVTFTLTQNAAGDGIIDPSHLVFSFKGVDIAGKPMDPAWDEYDGFRVTPF